jgi:hypothetical protein
MRALLFILAVLVTAPTTSDLARAADEVPAFDIDRNCRGDAAAVGNLGGDELGSCKRDEADAKKQLAEQWSRFGADAKRSCIAESSVGGEQSYVELLSCLELFSGTGQARR